MLKTYDPGQMALIVGGKIVSGFADGSYIKLMRSEQAYNLKVGVDGEGSRSRSRNRSGKLEVTLMQTSDMNDYFSGLAAADEASNSGVVPMLLKDGSGRTVAGALKMWVQKMPDSEFQKEVANRVWVFETDDLDYFIGGN